MEDLPRHFAFDVFLQKYRYHLLVVLVGLILIGAGFLFVKKSLNFSSTKVEILQSSVGVDGTGEITAEISGGVIYPGVYKLASGSRVDDLLIVSGGFSADSDRIWTDKYLNRAAKLTDGQKVFIPPVSQHQDGVSAKNGSGDQTISPSFSSDSKSLININTASLSELDGLTGIGPVYGQKIIEHRPYSKTEELVTNGAVTQTLYEKFKNEVTVY